MLKAGGQFAPPTDNPATPRHLTQQITQYQGPIPRAEDLRAYELVVPGLADRIVHMAESETLHRHEMETVTVQSTFRERARGQRYGLAIGIVGVLAGAACVLTGHDWAGAGIGGGTVVSLVSAFVYGRRMESKESKDE